MTKVRCGLKESLVLQNRTANTNSLELTNTRVCGLQNDN